MWYTHFNTWIAPPFGQHVSHSVSMCVCGIVVCHFKQIIPKNILVFIHLITFSEKYIRVGTSCCCIFGSKLQNALQHSQRQCVYMCMWCAYGIITPQNGLTFEKLKWTGEHWPWKTCRLLSMQSIKSFCKFEPMVYQHLILLCAMGIRFSIELTWIIYPCQWTLYTESSHNASNTWNTAAITLSKHSGNFQLDCILIMLLQKRCYYLSWENDCKFIELNNFPKEKTALLCCACMCARISIQNKHNQITHISISWEFFIKFVVFFLSLICWQFENGQVEFVNVSSHAVMSHRCHSLKKNTKCISHSFVLFVF